MTRYLNSFFITMVLYLIAVFFFFFVFADSVIIPEKEEKTISLKHITLVHQEVTPQPVQPEPDQEVQGTTPYRANQERHHGRTGRDGRRNSASDARHARPPHRHANDRAVPGSVEQPPPGAPLLGSPLPPPP